MTPSTETWKLALDPLEPWDGTGLLLFLLLAAVLTALTVWTYLGVPGTSFHRIVTVLTLRLGALAIAFLMVLRPVRVGLQQPPDEPPEDSTLLIVVDASRSMDQRDESNGQSRWDYARRILAAPEVQNL